MKFKRNIAAVCSSIFVFVLSFLLFPQNNFTITTDTPPKVTVAPTATPAPVHPTEDSTAVPTKAATPSPVPTNPQEQLTDAQILQILLNDKNITQPLSGVNELVTAYLHAYYENDYDTVSSLVTDSAFLNASLMELDASNVKRVENIELYAKPGVNGIFSIVYASYSLYYNDIQRSVPQFSEYHVKRMSDGSYKLQTVPLSRETRELLLQARSTEGVQKIAISSLIRRYHTACLAVNEPLLNQCVTDTDYLNINYISSRYSVTESISDYDFLFYPGINEFDYIVFVTHKEKIVFSDTPAPCMEYYYIDVDELTGFPKIYLGITSLDTDAYCASVVQSDAIQSLAKQINIDMQKALATDDDLKDFYQLLAANAS